MPDAPDTPFASHAVGDALWLHWPSPNSRGSFLLGYELRWKPVGGDWVTVEEELKNTSYFLRRLRPSSTCE